MPSSLAQHLYGMVNGVYAATVLLLLMAGLSYQFQQRKRIIARGYFLIAVALALFGLHNLFFQAAHAAVSALVFDPDLLWWCRFAAPLALVLLTYLVVRITMMRSHQAFRLIKERRWIEYTLYALNVVTLLRLCFSHGWADASFVLVLNFVPTALAATMLCVEGIGYALIGRLLAALFGGLTLSAVWFAVWVYQTGGLGPEPQMLAIHVAYALVVLVFCFLTLRYAYRYTGSLFALGNYRDFRLAHDMIPSIHDQDFFLMYQPQVNLGSNQVSGLEALIRWQHPEQGLIAPDQFIQLAEQCELIDDLTKWIIRQAVADLRRLMDAGHPLRISINFSVKNFNAQLVAYMRQQLEDQAVPAQLLAIEITENLLMDDSAEVQAVFAQLADLGVEVALDDYGTGFSSLSYLRKLNLAELKIDRSFVMDLDQSDENAVIVRSTLQMSHSLNIRVVAEGVENHQVLEQLRHMNCDVVQGYGVARPMRFADMLAWLDQRRSQPA